MLIRIFLFSFFICFSAFVVRAQSPQLKIAVLNANQNEQKFTAQFAEKLSEQKKFRLLDEELARAVFNSAKIENPFNLSLEEAKNLGAGIDCDFFFVIKSETLRRSSFQKAVYFESYAVAFLVSARTGRLIAWEDGYFEAETGEDAKKSLLTEAKNIAARFTAKINEANERERAERSQINSDAILIEDLPEEKFIAEQNFRIPLPYKRLRPEYTEVARRHDMEATVDVTAELNERGEVTKTQIVRWAGFDLDEAAAENVKKMNFRPALRDGKAIPIRVLLRYNFRDLKQ